MHTGFGYFEGAHAGGLGAVDNVAFEAEAEDDEPVGVAALAALFDCFVDGVFADGTEFRADVEVGFLFTFGRGVEAFGMEGGADKTLNANKDSLLVSLADKLNNSRAILEDYCQVGEDLWQRFKGGREGTLWYYRRLVETYRNICDQPLVTELDKVVTELEKRAAALSSAYTLRHQLRQTQSLPVLTKIKAWLDTRVLDTLPKSPLGEAVTANTSLEKRPRVKRASLRHCCHK